MAVVKDGTTYELRISGLVTGSSNSKSKTVNYLNMKDSESGSGHSLDDAYAFGNFVNTYFMGLTMPKYNLGETSPLVEE